MNALLLLKHQYQKMIRKAQQCILYDVSRIQLTPSRVIYLRLILALFSHLCLDAMPNVILFSNYPTEISFMSFTIIELTRNVK